MRTLFPLVVACILVLAIAPALAENQRDEGLPAFFPEPRNPLLDARGHAILTLSPMYLEIHSINESTVAAEADLLVELAAAMDDATVDRLVRRLEQLDVERQLSILKVRIRYARSEGRYDEAFSLRQEMLQVLQKESASLM